MRIHQTLDMLAKKKVKRRPAKKAVMKKKPARAKYPTRKDVAAVRSTFEQSTWNGSEQSYSTAGGTPNVFEDGFKTPEQRPKTPEQVDEEDSLPSFPEEDPEQVDEVGDKVLYSKREILEDLKINAPRQRPMRLFVQHLERQDIKPQLTKEAGKMIVKYWWNPEAL